MTMRSIEQSPQFYARIAGALYLAIIVFGAFAEGFVANTVVVSGDAARTAHNIMASLQLWRISIIGDLIVVLFAVPLLWIEYLLLKPVSNHLALLALMFNIVSLGVESVSKLFLIAVVPILGSTEYLKGFDPQQLQILAMLALKLRDVAFNIALILFAFTCLVNGYLIFRSGYLPKLVGILMELAGVSYLTACFAALFAPAFSDLITPAILIPPFIGELSLCLWLLVNGVNVATWNARLSAAQAPGGHPNSFG